MEDVGLHPDSGNPIEDEPEYETRIEYNFICPFCEEDIDEDYSLEGLFLEAIKGKILETYCWNCKIPLFITFSFVELAAPYTAEVGFEVVASKKVA